MALHAGDRLGPYEILGGVGAGGMGEVYRARDPRLARTVAVKILPPSASADPSRLHRFEHEARAAGALSHPNILAVHDVGQHDGAPYLVMELLEGETLRQRLEQGPMPVRKAVDCALQTARGLAAAHDKGIVHRDLKPENLFVTRDGIVKILDFGLARLERKQAGDEATTVTKGTDPGTVMGTVGYMSPEQVRGEAADDRSDLFALGAVLYEMLTGRRAFHKDTSAETLNAILKEEPAEFPEDANVPPVLDRLVRHCLEKKPEERFQSTRDLIFDLEGSTGSSVTAGRPARVVPASRRWLARGVIGLLALAALAGTFLAGRRSATVPHIPTFRQITFRRGIAPSGRFMPDGKTVVYSACWDGGSCEIYSVRTDAPESRSLGLPPGQVVGVSSRGELAMLLTERSTYAEAPGTLARVAVSGGTPRPVAESVVCADWAPDGESFAALRSDAKGDLRIEFPLGTVLARQASADRPLTCPRFSPRGDRLAFGTSDGYQVLETMGGRSFSIKGIPEWQHGVWWSWSPDGAEIWFTASDSPEERPLEAVSLSGRRRLLSRVPGAVTVYDVSRDGLVLLEHAFTRQRVFARAPGEVAERELSIFDRTQIQDMSADGRFVLLTEGGAATHGTGLAYLRQTNGSPPMRLAAFGEATALSPDGRWALVIPELASVLAVPKSSGLRVIPVGAGDARDIATAGLLVYRADWVPDGKRILVIGRETAAGRGTRIFLLDPEAGGRRAITPEGVRSAHIPCDGRRVAVRGPTNRVTLYPLEGGEAREVPGLEPGTVPLRFSEDGASLLVSGPNPTRSAPIRIYRVVLASGARTLLHEIKPADMAGVWGLTANLSPVVTPDGRGYAYNYYQFLHSLFLAEGLK